MPVIVSPITGSGQTTALTGKQIVDEVARVVGGETENSIRNAGLACVNRCRRELNQHDFRFTKVSIASTAFVAAQQTYTLPSAFKKPAMFFLLDVNGKHYRDLQYFDDIYFTHWLPQQTLQQTPMIYTLRNDFADGLISFYPVPDSTAASNMTWAGEYFSRIATITDDTTPLAALPEEVTNVLILGGQAYLLREREKASPVTPQAYGDYQRALNLLLVADRRMTDENARFKLPSKRSYLLRNANDLYGYFPWP
jgi:hypothetical protein